MAKIIKFIFLIAVFLMIYILLTPPAVEVSNLDNYTKADSIRDNYTKADSMRDEINRYKYIEKHKNN